MHLKEVDTKVRALLFSKTSILVLVFTTSWANRSTLTCYTLKVKEKKATTSASCVLLEKKGIFVSSSTCLMGDDRLIANLAKKSCKGECNLNNRLPFPTMNPRLN